MTEDEEMEVGHDSETFHVVLRHLHLGPGIVDSEWLLFVFLIRGGAAGIFEEDPVCQQTQPGGADELWYKL